MSTIIFGTLKSEYLPPQPGMLRAKCRHDPAKGERTNGARARRTAEKKHRG